MKIKYDDSKLKEIMESQIGEEAIEAAEESGFEGYITWCSNGLVVESSIGLKEFIRHDVLSGGGRNMLAYFIRKLADAEKEGSAWVLTNGSVKIPVGYVHEWMVRKSSHGNPKKSYSSAATIFGFRFSNAEDDLRISLDPNIADEIIEVLRGEEE